MSFHISLFAAILMKNYLIDITLSDIRKDPHASRFLIVNDKNDHRYDWISFKHISQKITQLLIYIESQWHL